MNNELKDQIVSEGKTYWKELTIILLLICFTISVWVLIESKKDLSSEIAKHKAEQTKNDINNGAAGVNKNENEVYPKLDDSIGKLNNNILMLNKNLNKSTKNKPTKEKSYETFKNKNVQELHQYFINAGFNNSVSDDISSSK